MWGMRSVRNVSRSDSRERRRRTSLPLGSTRDFPLEVRCLLSGVGMPTDTVSSDIGVGGVLYNGVTGQYVKQISIANNSTETIYPFLGRMRRLVSARSPAVRRLVRRLVSASFFRPEK